MPTIFCVTQGLPGLLYSSVELARRLAADGHRLIYASFAHARATAVEHGLDFVALDPSRYPEFVAADRRSGTLDRLRHLPSRRRRARDSTAVDGWVETVRRIDPDLILIDGEMHEHVLAAAASRAPIALLNTFVSIWRRPGLPPPHHLVRPGVGWRGSRIGISLLWHALRLRKWRTAWTHRVRRVGCDRLSVLRQLAAESGFDFRRETDDGQWLIPFTYRRLPVLCLHALEFEFPHRPPERAHYVGPMVLESRADDRLTDEVRAELETMFERRRIGGGERRLIYAGFGSSFSTAVGLLHRLIEAVAGRDDWDLVVSLGGRIEPQDLGRLPDGVHAFAWLPQIDVLRHADAAVTHGGINTIDECVAAGVPMLVYCGFETDMAGNTARVVYHRIGIAGDRRDRPAVIRRHLDRLLSDRRFERNVERLGRRYAAYAENRVAERTVASLLARGPAR